MTSNSTDLTLATKMVELGVKIELTSDEAMMTVYALKELASRRYEQAMDCKQDFLGIRKEADDHVVLSNKILNSIPKSK